MITAIIAEYKKGERTIKGNCSDKGIKGGLYWLSKQKKNNQSIHRPAFVPVTIKGDQLEEKAFVGYKGLKLYHPVSVEFLKALIS